MGLTGVDILDEAGRPLQRVVGLRPHPGPILRKEHFQELLDWTCQQPPATSHRHFGNLLALLIRSKGLWGVEKLRRLVHGEFGDDVAAVALKTLRHGVAPAVGRYDGEESSYPSAAPARLCLEDSGTMLRLAVMMEAGVPPGASAQERSEWLDALSGSEMERPDIPRDLLSHVYELTQGGRAFRTESPSTRFYLHESVAAEAVHLVVETNPKHESIERILGFGGPLAAMVAEELMRAQIAKQLGASAHVFTTPRSAPRRLV